MSAAVEFQTQSIHCSACGETYTADSALKVFHAMQLHKKFCTPKRVAPREETTDDDYDTTRLCDRRTYTGRMNSNAMNTRMSAAKRAEDAARADVPQVDAMINEGGRP